MGLIDTAVLNDSGKTTHPLVESFSICGPLETQMPGDLLQII